MRWFRFASVVPGLLAGGLLLLTATASQAQVVGRPVGERYWAVVGNSAPIFLTSINYPGLYGAYNLGVEAHAYNTRPSAPTFHGIDPATVLPEEAAAAAADPAGVPAYFRVAMPKDATLWVQGVRMDPTGELRDFVSPPLIVGQGYTYKLRAAWVENGREMTQERTVRITAGDRLSVDMMPVAPGTATLRTRPMP